MTPVQAFHSTNERQKPLAERRYHNNDSCRVGQAIAQAERRSGTGEYPQCEECARVTRRPESAG